MNYRMNLGDLPLPDNIVDANGYVRESRYGAFDLLQSQTDAEGNPLDLRL